jgi:hypothetical protein
MNADVQIIVIAKPSSVFYKVGSCGEYPGCRDNAVRGRSQNASADAPKVPIVVSIDDQIGGLGGVQHV